MNEWINEQINELTNEWTSEWLTEWTNVSMDEWTNLTDYIPLVKMYSRSVHGQADQRFVHMGWKM